ncbi:MAG: hypothetical protein KGN16_11295 [Burkholderiales bacterium]|nr:hypothetical protein [Burkholderiales bacterium]
MLLRAAAAIYLVLGDLGVGALLAFFALVTVGLVVWQERRSGRAIDALRSRAAPPIGSALRWKSNSENANPSHCAFVKWVIGFCAASISNRMAARRASSAA